ncbi:MAG: RsmB/NOP family class I SAM-dependent RNA methyltransferase [Bacteroidota bacterium]
MKLHRTLVQAIITTLQQIFVEGRYADKAVEHVLKQNSKWGSRDRHFIAETIYGMVRWWRLLEITAEIENPKTEKEYWKLFAAWCVINEIGLPDWKDFFEIDKSKLIENYSRTKSVRKYRESIPDWLDELGSKELGEKVWEKELAELNKKAKVVLRVNTLKTTLEELQKKLSEQNVEVEMICNASPLWGEIKRGALVLKKRQQLNQLNEYKQGLFEIQDASSQLIAGFLQVQPGMTVIDACAGAGGKSLHIAAMMKNAGKIISMDVEERKLVELKKRADRAGASIIKTQLINPNTIHQLKNSADRLLLDVPCSGLGVLRRTPDAKWKLNPDFIDQVKRTQQEIIGNYSQMLKSGGIMVYATCSILPSENQDQMEKFLKSNPHKFELLSDRKVLPSEGFDGFYMCALRKCNE